MAPIFSRAHKSNATDKGLETERRPEGVGGAGWGSTAKTDRPAPDNAGSAQDARIAAAESSGRSPGGRLSSLLRGLFIVFLFISTLYFSYLAIKGGDRCLSRGRDCGVMAVGLILAAASVLGIVLLSRRGRKGDKLKGEVRSFDRRAEGEHWSVWSFRLERYDQNGNRLTPVSVEMRGMAFVGTVSDGDIVQVAHANKGRRISRLKKVQNLTTGITVIAKQRLLFYEWSFWNWFFFCVFILGIISLAAVIIISIAT